MSSRDEQRIDRTDDERTERSIDQSYVEKEAEALRGEGEPVEESLVSDTSRVLQEFSEDVGSSPEQRSRDEGIDEPEDSDGAERPDATRDPDVAEGRDVTEHADAEGAPDVAADALGEPTEPGVPGGPEASESPETSPGFHASPESGDSAQDAQDAADPASAEDGLPPIETWWPHLTAGARHAVTNDVTGDLDPRVREEIERITGARVPDGARLGSEDRGYVGTQTEQVD